MYDQDTTDAPSETSPTGHYQPPTIDPDCPQIYGERLSETLMYLRGVICTVQFTREGERYWRSEDRCPVHDVPYTTYITATGQMVDWFHLNVDERNLGVPCYRQRPQE